MTRMSEHLRSLESEAIGILREAAAASPRAVLLYSIGKDSSVLLHLALKAFAPAPLPFPLLHIDTRYKFREMIDFRDRIASEKPIRLITWTNEQALAEGMNPFDHDASVYTAAMKTVALRAALDHHGFDIAIGGARRDEERSRAKERVFSLREKGHVWDPRNQRPEFFGLYNTALEPGTSLRCFPLSNWTEMDIWRYIEAENIDIVPLYFAMPRPVVSRGGQWIMVDDARFRLAPDEVIRTETVRFRTLGCYPLSAAIESTATTVGAIIEEIATARRSERVGRVIDHVGSSMEEKKREGYF